VRQRNRPFPFIFLSEFDHEPSLLSSSCSHEPLFFLPLFCPKALVNLLSAPGCGDERARRGSFSTDIRHVSRSLAVPCFVGPLGLLSAKSQINLSSLRDSPVTFFWWSTPVEELLSFFFLSWFVDLDLIREISSAPLDASYPSTPPLVSSPFFVVNALLLPLLVIRVSSV